MRINGCQIEIFSLPRETAYSPRRKSEKSRCTDEKAAKLASANRPLSLLHAEGPKRLVNATGLSVLNECQPGRFATLCARKFLGRYHGAIGNAEPADDD